jgi:hypothetical protein
MELFRVQEAVYGFGPFTYEDVEVWRPDWVPKHFWDNEWLRPPNQGDWFYAAKTLAELFDWFGHPVTWRELCNAGYSCVRLTIPDESVILGDIQAVYDKSAVLETEFLSYPQLSVERRLYEERKLGVPSASRGLPIHV